MRQTNGADIIRTERLCLRPLQLEDTEALYRFASNREHTRYMIYYPHASIEETRTFVEHAAEQWSSPKPEGLEFAVLSEGELIGTVSLYFEGEPGEAELAWLLAPEACGKGYATEAAMALMKYAAEVWRADRIIACCDSRNLASARVMERIGLTLEDAARTREYPKTGEISGELLYAKGIDFLTLNC